MITYMKFYMFLYNHSIKLAVRLNSYMEKYKRDKINIFIILICVTYHIAGSLESRWTR